MPHNNIIFRTHPMRHYGRIYGSLHNANRVSRSSLRQNSRKSHHFASRNDSERRVCFLTLKSPKELRPTPYSPPVASFFWSLPNERLIAHLGTNMKRSRLR